MKPGIVVFAHGSRLEPANEAVRSVARQLASAGNFDHVEPAFLEGGEPDLPGAVARLHAAGVTRVLVLPYFLTLGIHLERDLPRIVDDISSRYNDLQIRVAPPLAGHPGLLSALLERARD